MIRSIYLALLLILASSISCAFVVQQFPPPSLVDPTQFGYSTAIAGPFLFVGAPVSYEQPGGAGNVFVYKKADQYTQFQILGASVRTLGDSLGQAITAYENTLVASADRSNVNATTGGIAFVYEFSTSWKEKQVIFSPSATDYYYFGFAVSLHQNTLMITALNASGPNTGDYEGRVHVYEKINGIFNPVAVLSPNDNYPGAFYGCAVSVYGGYALVGAKQDKGTPVATNAGSAYLYGLQNGQWTQLSKIYAPTRSTSSNFGSDVSLFKTTGVIGSKKGPSGNKLDGIFYVYEFVGNTTVVPTQVISPDAVGTNPYQSFGESVCIYDDTIIAVAGGFDLPGKPDVGAAYIFKKDGSGVWNNVARIVDPTALDNERLGTQSRPSCGDNTFAVGAPKKCNNDPNDPDNCASNTGTALVFSDQSVPAPNPAETSATASSSNTGFSAVS
jgi:hypothetical protein